MENENGSNNRASSAPKPYDLRGRDPGRDQLDLGTKVSGSAGALATEDDAEGLDEQDFSYGGISACYALGGGDDYGEWFQAASDGIYLSADILPPSGIARRLHRAREVNAEGPHHAEPAPSDHGRAVDVLPPASPARATTAIDKTVHMRRDLTRARSASAPSRHLASPRAPHPVSRATSAAVLRRAGSPDRRRRRTAPSSRSRADRRRAPVVQIENGPEIAGTTRRRRPILRAMRGREVGARRARVRFRARFDPLVGSVCPRARGVSPPRRSSRSGSALRGQRYERPRAGASMSTAAACPAYLALAHEAPNLGLHLATRFTPITPFRRRSIL